MSISLTTSDLSRAVQLRRANQDIKAQLSALTHEVTTGRRHDLAAAQRGDMGPVAFISCRLTTLDALSSNAALIGNELEAVQTALGAVQSLVGDKGAAFLADAAVGNPATMAIHARQAAGDMEAVVASFNVSAGGRQLLSGAATDTAPLSPAADILSMTRAIAAGQPSAGQAIAAIDAWFDAPAGGGGFLDMAYRGAPVADAWVAVAPGTKVVNPATAADASVRATLKGLAIAALAADPGIAPDPGSRALMIQAAGERLVGGSRSLTALQAAVGSVQATVEDAASRNDAEVSGLKIMHNKLASADPYESATALTEAEGRLEKLYALTARLSRLSLADYL